MRGEDVAGVAGEGEAGVNLLADWCERGVRVVAVTQQVDLRS